MTALSHQRLLAYMHSPASLALREQLTTEIAPYIRNKMDSDLVHPNLPVPTDPLIRLLTDAVHSMVHTSRRDLPRIIGDAVCSALSQIEERHLSSAPTQRSASGMISEETWQKLFAESRLAQDLWQKTTSASVPSGGLIGGSSRASPNPQQDREQLGSLWNNPQLMGAGARFGPKLTALDFITKTLLGNKRPLKNFKLYALQHPFSSTGSLLDAVHNIGIPYRDMRLLGKLYSSNFHVAATAVSRGIQVNPISLNMFQQHDFRKGMNDAIELDLSQQIATLPDMPEDPPKQRFLIIDDGGKAIVKLHELLRKRYGYDENKLRAYAKYFCCVEQTRYGARAVRELEEKGQLLVPVVNVAECWAKLKYESPMIGHSVVLELGRKLDRLEAYGALTNNDSDRTALVIGYGAVGQAVAESLRARGYKVLIQDKDPARMQNAAQRGYTTEGNLHDKLPNADVVVSCVGVPTLGPKEHRCLKDGVVLVNAASSDEELGPEFLRMFHSTTTRITEDGRAWDSFRGKPVFCGNARAEAHCDQIIRYRTKEEGPVKEVFLMSNGYVVNMTGERDPIPGRFIQLTRGLLLLAAAQASKHDKPGFFDLELAPQKKLVAFIQNLLRRRKPPEDLLKPNFNSPPLEVYPIPDHLRAELEEIAQVTQAWSRVA